MRSNARSARRRAGLLSRLPTVAGSLLALALLLGLAPSARAEETKDEPAANPPGDAPADAPVADKSFLPDVIANLKNYKGLLEAVRSYFDLDVEPWRGRKALLDALVAEADAGRYWLKDMDALRWLVYQGRTFNSPMTDRKWRQSQGIAEYKSLSGSLHWIKSEMMTIAFSIPKSYPKMKDLRTKTPRMDPLPLLLTMHEKRDYTGQKYPGEVLLKRRYPKKQWGELYEDWLVLCPVAAAGNYLDDESKIRPEVFQGPYSIFWKHYHVDFDRVILDGTDQAFPAAASQGIFFAGVVFRPAKGKKWELTTDQMKEDVRNFSTVPVYVVDNPKLAKQLEAAGHKAVTAGIGGANLMTWMKERRRKDPRKFQWTVQRGDQLLPYWVNLEGLDWSSPERSLDIEVVDTDKEPNTIKITARGVDTLALFLNDEVVDLDEKIRVIINGHIEHDSKVEPELPVMKKIGRDLDALFDLEPTRIRLSMFFGWLKSARIVQLAVRPPAVKKADPAGGNSVAPTGPKATPKQEDRAKGLMRKARKLIERGNDDGAKKALKSILDLPQNAQTDEAKKLMGSLEGK